MTRSPAVTAVLGVFALATVPVLAQGWGFLFFLGGVFFLTITGLIPGYELTQTLHGRSSHSGAMRSSEQPLAGHGCGRP